jgi:hypothetical protein
VFTVIVIATMILSAIAYRGWFRLYAMATLAVVVAFGAAAGFAIRGIEQNETVWAGGFERINAYAYFAWLIVLAVMVAHHELDSPRVGDEVDGSRPEVPE